MERNLAAGIMCVCLYIGGIACAIGVENQEEGRNTVGRNFDPKQVLSSLAGSFMSRGYLGAPGGGSQVVSLNLTNLVVLVLLKALIFAAGSLGAGTWKGGYGRSLDGEERLLTDEELLLFLSYLTGTPGNNGCLQNVACQQPQQAKRYVAAGDLLLKAARTVSIEPQTNYDYVLQEVQEASSWGLAGRDCKRFSCGEGENKNP